MTERKNNKRLDDDLMKIDFSELEREFLSGDKLEKRLKKFIDYMQEIQNEYLEKQDRKIFIFRVMILTFYIIEIIFIILVVLFNKIQ